jgi:glycosyltransferase involved in cell wall biosynthesis
MLVVAISQKYREPVPAVIERWGEISIYQLTKASVIIPSKGCSYIKHSLLALRGQTLRPHETVLVVKKCNIKEVEDLCRKAGLSCVVIEQRRGFATHALNLGKKNATGDLMLFTDDDATPLSKWYREIRKAPSRLPPGGRHR